MGFRLKKTKAAAPPEPPTHQQLAALSADDLYILVESSLMDAQYRLTQYRTSSAEDKSAHLQWLRSNVRSADAGLRTLQSKLLSS